jgi:tetratricopeptide (TPR) repeat protein
VSTPFQKAANFDPQDTELLANVTALLDRRSFREARQFLDARIAHGLPADDRTGRLLLAEIAALLIDIGCEGRDEQAIRAGLSLLEKNRRLLDGLLTAASIDYNLGNAKRGLAELRSPNPLASPGLADHDLLLAAKNHYWAALKSHKEDDNFAKLLGTNLGSMLRKSGRITEALTAYDEVLANDPAFTMAHFHRGLALLALEKLSGARTVTLLRQAAAEYTIAAEVSDARPSVREVAITMRDRTLKRLMARGYNLEQLQDEGEEMQREAAGHSAYRQFTLRYHLGLSEHSLYCHCNGARRDNLMIATNKTPVTGDLVPRLEHILNRLKAEFGTARLLYYQATTDQSWDLHEHEVTYAELFEGETVSMRTELLRTSFRLCLGILDKIALGICELYDVADPHEKLYFESFWQPSARKGKAVSRWTALTAKSRNPALVALYSQATDLRSDGEWSLFKAWRNDLEHRFLILTDAATPPDLWNAREGTFGTRCIGLSEFTERTLRLLQFTRSAIFNFTYCARHETRAPRDREAMTRTIQHKCPEPKPKGPPSRKRTRGSSPEQPHGGPPPSPSI